MRDYELTYIVKPDIDPATLTALVERVSGFVTAEGGTVSKTTQWGLRHLAYPIRRFREGHYIFTTIQIESPALARIEQKLRLVEDVLRYLLVRADEDATTPDTDTADVMGGEAVEAVDAVAPIEAVEAAPAPVSAIETASEPAPVV